ISIPFRYTCAFRGETFDMRHMEAVTEGETLNLWRIPHQGNTVHRRRIDIVNYPRIRAKPLNIACAFHNNGQFAHCPEDTTGPNGIAGTHANAILLGNFTVNTPETNGAIRKAEDNKIRARQNVLPIIRGFDFERYIIRGDDHL